MFRRSDEEAWPGPDGSPHAHYERDLRGRPPLPFTPELHSLLGLQGAFDEVQVAALRLSYPIELQTFFNTQLRPPLPAL